MKKALALVMAGALSGPVCGKTLTIGIDLSGSNPLLTHENFAYGASQYVGNAISALKSGDIVQIKTFGARADAKNLLAQRITVSRRNRPEKIAEIVSQFVRSLPEREATAQSSTNLVAWLEFTSDFDCAEAGEILVITDGLESSSYVDAKDLISGRKALPAADVSLKGCALTFYGLGAGWKPQEVKTVRKAWRQWAEQAQTEFNAVIP